MRLNLGLSLPALALRGRKSIPSWVLPGASIDLDFANGRYFGGTLASLLSTACASSATDLLPQSVSGYAYNTFGTNVNPVSPTVGVLPYEARTNLLLNSNAPATQTTASLGIGTYTLWCNGSGSVLASGGSATITGAASATNGSPNTFTVTIAGTVTVTVTGSLNAFQLELGAFGTPFIVTTGATATKAAQIITIGGLLDTILHGSAGSIFVYTNLGNNSQGGGVNRLIGDNGGAGLMLRNGSGSPNPLSSYNGVTQLNTATTVTWATAHKSGVRWTAIPARSLVLDGGAIATDAAAVGVRTTYFLGSTFNAVAFANGPITRLIAYNSAISDALFQANTT